MNEIIIDQKVFKKYDDMYYISADGDVYSTYCNRLLKHNIDIDGYHRVDIHSKHKKIHQLVYETWIGPIDQTKQINHKDDDKNNNHYTNLYQGTQKENIIDKHENKHFVGNTFYLTLMDKERNKIITFCPACKFIEYCHHSNKSGSLNKFFKKNWFKKRYIIIEFKRIKNLAMFINMKGVTTKGDECNPVE